MFKAGHRYRHPNCLDVDMYVTKVTPTSAEGTKLEVIWLTQVSSAVIKPDSVIVQLKDHCRWGVVNEMVYL